MSKRPINLDEQSEPTDVILLGKECQVRQVNQLELERLSEISTETGGIPALMIVSEIARGCVIGLTPDELMQLTLQHLMAVLKIAGDVQPSLTVHRGGQLRPFSPPMKH
jgi:hypothetical protein